MTQVGDSRRAPGSDDAIRLLVTIDTEEDQWGPPRTDPSLTNIQQLPRLHRLFRDLDLRPTYLTAYQVAVDPDSVAILREVSSDDATEIGAHLHPWNTPPETEKPTLRNSMLNNLQADLQRRKLEVLTDALERAFHRRPRSFRGGRLGFDAGTVEALAACGYEFDTTVAPYMDLEHRDGGPDFTGAPVDVYRLGTDSDVRCPDPDGKLLEIPMSVGYTRLPFGFWHPIHRGLESIRLGRFAASGVLSRAGLLQKVFLSPELDRTPDMMALARTLVRRGTRHLNLFLHSSTLVPGLTPFTRTEREVDEFLSSIREFVEELTGTMSLRSATVSEFGDRVLAGERA